MNVLVRIFGLPHEALHLLGLLIIGRRAVHWTSTHVDIPDDLSLKEYLIVAGMPALVFSLITGIGMLGLYNARAYGDAILPLIVMLIGGLAFSGTAGDLQLISERLTSKK